MAFITLDFETFFRSTKNIGTPGEKYSLKGMTYEEYISDPKFKVHGVGVKINNAPTRWITERIPEALTEIFTPGNDHTVLCHNALFDGAILSWYYGLAAKKYYCTQALSRALWSQSRHGLADLAKRCFPDDPTKRKGKELEDANGIYDLTPEQLTVLGNYCINDCDLTFDCFARMWKYFPEVELQLVDMTLQMFIHPAFVLDAPLVKDYYARLLARKQDLIKSCGVSASVLGSDAQFTDYLLKRYNIVVPYKASPTVKNPQNTTLALAKDDLEFLELRATYPELRDLWDARVAVKSSGEINRCTRFLGHAKRVHHKPAGVLAMPLNYGQAHTNRWAGTNKVNVQNLKRSSPLRYALCAPEGYKVNVRDLSNIEGRINAWFNEQNDKLEVFADPTRDLYNEVGETIYGFKIDRKLVIPHPDTGEDYSPWKREGHVAKTAELGLGYQTGANKLWVTLNKQDVDVDLAFAEKTVKRWREKNYMIVQGWRKLEAVIAHMADPKLEPYDYRCLRVEPGRLVLPNGLALTYPGLEAELDEQYNRYSFTYWNGKFRKSIYGGALLENCIQALARVLLGWQMVNIAHRIDPLGARIVLTVHDEIVTVTPDAHAETVDQIMAEEMARCPDWCNDGSLTLASEGGWAQNYSK